MREMMHAGIYEKGPCALLKFLVILSQAPRSILVTWMMTPCERLIYDILLVELVDVECALCHVTGIQVYK